MPAGGTNEPIMSNEVPVFTLHAHVLSEDPAGPQSSHDKLKVPGLERTWNDPALLTFPCGVDAEIGPSVAPGTVATMVESFTTENEAATPLNRTPAVSTKLPPTMVTFV